MLFFRKRHAYFLNNMHRSREVQEQLLFSLLRDNQDTVFGQKHNFKTIKTVAAYRQQVPPGDYSSFEPYIARIVQGAANELTRQKVKLLEPTGGSESGSKLIPYTARLQEEFNAGVHCWLYDLFSAFPALLRGRSYWSISPCGAYSRQETKVPIGFEDDAAYLGLIGKLLRQTLVMPGEAKRLKDMDNFRYLTALFLLKTPDLSLISVWNPTFLLILLDFIGDHIGPLLKDIHDGTCTLPVPEEIPYLADYFTAAPSRARELERLYAGNEARGFSRFWKNLALISCWGDGPAAIFAPQLTRQFPGVHFQYKGLLATEGIISFPLEKARGNCPAYTSHFLEFIPQGENPARPLLLHELEPGSSYQVLLTTGGGLYRYNLGDIIAVTGRFQGLPLFTFTGREKTSDLFGEKLSESQVQKSLDTVFKELQLKPEFYLVAPELLETAGYYVLYVQTPEQLTPGQLQQLARLTEAQFAENFHYHYARSLNQLHPLRAISITNGPARYLERGFQEGRKAGDIKPAVLDKRTGWKQYMTAGPVD